MSTQETDAPDYTVALSPTGTVHALKDEVPQTLCGRDATLSDGWGWGKRFFGDWDGNFPPPYEHEAACVLCSHNYESKTNTNQ